MWFVTEPPDDCTCRWINRSEASGWELIGRNPLCPEHGDGGTEPRDDGVQ